MIDEIEQRRAIGRAARRILHARRKFLKGDVFIRDERAGAARVVLQARTREVFSKKK